MTEYGLLLEDISGNVQFPMDVFSEVAQPKVRKVTVYHSSDSHDPKTLEEEIEAVRFGFRGLLQTDVVERERKLHYLLRTDNDIILIYFDRDVATYVSMSRGIPQNDPASNFDIFSIECTAKGAVLGQVREAVDARCTTDSEEIEDTDAMRDKAIVLDYSDLTVADWQKNAATGTATNPAGINDDSVATTTNFDAVDEYCEIEFDELFYINKFRHFGYALLNEDGTYKLQYFDCGTQAWIDWETGISTRLATWSDWADLDLVLTNKVRIIATTLDTKYTSNLAGEFELKYENPRSRGKDVYFTQVQNDYMLPDGSYNMVARMKQSADASDNLSKMEVDVSGNPSITQTLTTAYLIYELPFTVDASANGYDLGATIQFKVSRTDECSGNITIDFLGYAAVQ